MARVEKHPDDMSPEELRADIAKLERLLEEARRDGERSEGRIDDLQVEINELNEKIDDNNAGFLRDQLDTLATDFDPSTVTRDQFERLIKGILRGDDWRYRTWM